MRSSLEQSVDAVWTEIDRCVTQGLSSDPPTGELTTILSVVDRPDDLARHVRYEWRTINAGGLQARQLSVHVGNITELSSDLELRPDDLDHPDYEAITKWASDVRSVEKAWALNQLVAAGEDSGELTAEFLDPATYGRLIGPTELEKTASERGIEFASSNGLGLPNGIVAILTSREVAVSRLEDFALSWNPQSGACELRLRARLKLIGVPVDGATPLVRRFASIAAPLATG